MILESISSKEFDRYAKSSPLSNFYQTSYWGVLKEKNGWKKHFLALKEDDKIKGATLLLEKKVFIGSIFYAPRGFLLDYEYFDLLELMTLKIKEYVKKHKGILFKIDPYLMLQERDIDGNLVKDGISYQHVVEKLNNLGYQNVLEKKETGTLQPNFIFVLDLKDLDEESLLKTMDSQTRWSIHKTEKIGFEVVELEKKELDSYKKIMEHTASRRGFIDRPLSYYQDMYNALGDHIKVLVARLNTKQYLATLKKEQEENHRLKEEALEKLKEIPNSKKFTNQLKVCEEAQNNIHKKLEEAIKLKEEHGELIDMAGAMFITYGNEVVYLFSGAYDEFMHFNAQYALQWKMIKYAIKNNYQRYNFYGISKNLTKEDSMYGVYTFKRGFGGNVVELIGEYDYIVNKWKYMLYKAALKFYKLTKR